MELTAHCLFRLLYFGVGFLQWYNKVVLLCNFGLRGVFNFGGYMVIAGPLTNG